MLLPICFIIVTASNMNDTYSKMLVQTNRIVSVVTSKKHSNMKVLEAQYINTYDIKETPEEVSSLIKKECK